MSVLCLSNSHHDLRIRRFCLSECFSDIELQGFHNLERKTDMQ